LQINRCDLSQLRGLSARPGGRRPNAWFKGFDLSKDDMAGGMK
jgi:hypothetical protein